MAKTRTRKAFFNSTTSLFSEIVSLVCGLILPRLILANFGSAYNGISSSVSQLLSAVSIFNVGITGSTRMALYRSLADHDIKKTSGIIKSSAKYTQKVGYILLAFLLILIVFYPIVVDTGYSWIEVAPLIIAAGITAAGQYFFGLTYQALLMADQCLYISNIFLTASTILNLVLSVILIRLGCTIQTVRLASSLVLVLNPVLRAVYVRKKYHLDLNCEPDHSALAMRKDVTAHAVANIVHDHTDIVVLTFFCNVKIVSVYTVYNLVMVALRKAQAVLTSGAEAVFGNMWAKKELDKIREYLILFEYIICSFACIVFSTAFVVILPFISLYTKGVTDVEYILPVYSVVIISAQMVFAFRAPYLAVIQGTGHYKETKKGAYAEAVINLVSSIILVQFFGIVGVAIGTLLANLIRTVQFAFFIDNNIVHRGKHVFILRIVWTVASVLVTVAVCSFFKIQQHAYQGWLMWVIYSTFAVGLGGIIVIVSSILFYKKDFFEMLELIKRLLKKEKKN